MLLLPINPSLTLCRSWPHELPALGDLVPVLSNGLRARVTAHVFDGARVWVPSDLRGVKSFLADGWRRYQPGPVKSVTFRCAPGGERFTLGWAMSRKLVEDDAGETWPAVCVRAWTYDRCPGVVVALYRLAGVGVEVG